MEFTRWYCYIERETSFIYVYIYCLDFFLYPLLTTRECVKQGTCVNVKLEFFVHEFVKHDDITRIYNLQVSFV